MQLLDRFHAAKLSLSEAIAQLEQLRTDVTAQYQACAFPQEKLALVPVVSRNLSLAITEAETAQLRASHALDTAKEAFGAR